MTANHVGERLNTVRVYDKVMYQIARVLLAHHGLLDESLDVDHINGYVEDNQKSNLRCVTKNQNSMNVPQWNPLGYRGVRKCKTSVGFSAKITINRKEIYLGTHNTPEDAFKAYIERAKLENVYQYLPLEVQAQYESLVK